MLKQANSSAVVTRHQKLQGQGNVDGGIYCTNWMDHHRHTRRCKKIVALCAEFRELLFTQHCGGERDLVCVQHDVSHVC